MQHPSRLRADRAQDRPLSASAGLSDHKRSEVQLQTYVDALSFMRRSGRCNVPVEAIVALIAFILQDCEPPSARRVMNVRRSMDRRKWGLDDADLPKLRLPQAAVDEASRRLRTDPARHRFSQARARLLRKRNAEDPLRSLKLDLPPGKLW